MHETTITLRELLDQGRETLDGLESACIDAEILLCHALGYDRSRLYSRPGVMIAADQQSIYTSLISARRTGKPVAYLTGKKEFWSIELIVNENTLVPRPETECLVETVLDHIPKETGMKVADLGTGCGAVAIAIASERPCCNLIASDIDEKALDVAGQNACNAGAGRIRFVRSDWFSDINDRFDAVVSNPPYIADNDPHLSQPDIAHEPVRALRGGRDGLDAIRRIIEETPEHINNGGWLFLEHGFDQASTVRELFNTRRFTNVTTRKDYAGQERVTYGQYKTE